jgi:cellulose synthase/poly-beta-1,6-N-acetylglucosamine synthase-like glycosyltransferase
MPANTSISAIVPARDEEAVIAACVEALAVQTEIAEIFVVDDHSRDRTAEIVRGLREKHPQVKLLEAGELPDGWAGKNNAAWAGAQQATGGWLLFTDADSVLLDGAAAKALQDARQSEAAMVSYSPEQLLVRWYEKALIPFVYCRLARRFAYEDVNNADSRVAAANGQFLLVRRDAYDTIGGHASVAGEILEDVALAIRLKKAGYRIRFAPGTGIVRTRMYRSFRAMWEGWKKNLYRLMGGTPRAAFSEIDSVLPWMAFLVLLVGIKLPIAIFLGVLLLIFRQITYGLELRRNHFRFSFILYYIPAVLMYSLVLWQSYRSHVRGRIQWKGREYQIEAPGVSE